MTPARLRRLAAQEDERARLATLKAELYRRAADKIEEQLQANTSSVNKAQVDAPTPARSPEHRLAISKSRGGGSRLQAEANARGYSLRRLARELGVPHTSLSHWSSGARPIPLKWAEAIEALVGYQAKRENWPGGISS